VKPIDLIELEQGPRVAFEQAVEIVESANKRRKWAAAEKALTIRTTPKGVNVPRHEVSRRRKKGKQARQVRRRNRGRR